MLLAQETPMREICFRNPWSTICDKAESGSHSRFILARSSGRPFCPPPDSNSCVSSSKLRRSVLTGVESKISLKQKTFENRNVDCFTNSSAPPADKYLYSTEMLYRAPLLRIYSRRKLCV